MDVDTTRFEQPNYDSTKKGRSAVSILLAQKRPESDLLGLLGLSSWRDGSRCVKTAWKPGWRVTLEGHGTQGIKVQM